MAGQQQRFDRVLPVPPEALFAAFSEAVKDGRYKVVRVDDFARSIEFKTIQRFMTFDKAPILVQGQVTSDDRGSRIELVIPVVAFTGGKREAKEMGALLADISSRAAKAVVL